MFKVVVPKEKLSSRSYRKKVSDNSDVLHTHMANPERRSLLDSSVPDFGVIGSPVSNLGVWRFK